VGESEAQKGPGSDFVCDIFCRVCETKKSRKNWHRNFGRFFGKSFRHGLFANLKIYFCCVFVFELPLPRNAQKRPKKNLKKKNRQVGAGGSGIW
jgi:hypothetical protein